MKVTEKLDDIWQAYLVTKDGLKIAGRSIDQEDNTKLLNNTTFITSSIDEAKQNIEISRKNADDYVVLSLWAVFERYLFDCFALEAKRMLIKDLHRIYNPSHLTQKIYEKIEYDVEYWRVADALDILKTIIDAKIIGRVKQIKEYRDWVAHKNPKKPMPTNVTPKNTYEILLDVVQQIEVVANQTESYLFTNGL